MPQALYVGLMSGTSIDGIDAVLAQVEGDDFVLLATHQHPVSSRWRERLANLMRPGNDGVDEVAATNVALGREFAAATRALLDHARVAAAEVRAVGSHGQTIRHQPPDRVRAIPGFSVQIGDPATIAELTGITTVSDFRGRDMAAGGEGAPLAPAFHRAVFSHASRHRAIVNIGGIANVSLLHGTELVGGFDTGPGNTLLDYWVDRNRNERYDADGSWGAEGRVDNGLLGDLLADPYFQRAGPRSTGRERFNARWLEQVLAGWPPVDPRDVQATLAELTALSIARGIQGADSSIEEVYVCGGGARNSDLMRRLYRHIAPAELATTDGLGLAPEWVEAAAFAWLAAQTLNRQPGNAPQVTGASGGRVLGAIHPA